MVDASLHCLREKLEKIAFLEWYCYDMLNGQWLLHKAKSHANIA